MTVRIVIEIDDKARVTVHGSDISAVAGIGQVQKVGRPPGGVKTITPPINQPINQPTQEIFDIAEYVDTPFDPATGQILQQKKPRKKPQLSEEFLAKKKLVFQRYNELMKRGYPRQQALILANRSVYGEKK